MCKVCYWVAPLILIATMVLLLLVNLGVGMGAFGDFVGEWWPVGVVLYGLSGFCPCGGSCCKTDNCCD